jgi:hypothetical protein
MASPHFPFSHVPSEMSFSPVVGAKGHPPTVRTTDVRQRTRRIPEWLAASGLTIGKQSTSFQHRLSTSHKDGIRLHKAKGERPPTPRADLLRAGFPHSGTHRLDVRQPGQPSKKPTREASKPSHSEPPFNLLSVPVETSPWVKPISWQRPRQRDLVPLRLVTNVSLG